MSNLAYGRYYVLISSHNRRRKLFRSFYNPKGQDILDAASEVGIHGKYLVSAENNAIIGDTYALRYALDKNQMLIVTDSLDAEERVSFQTTINESTTDENFDKQLDNTKIQNELSGKLNELRSQITYVLGSVSKFLQDFANPQTGQPEITA